MAAKYATGAKVRINAAEAAAGFPFSETWKYGNMTGEVLDSRAVVAYVVHADYGLRSAMESIQAYTIRLDVGLQVDNVIEDCLEAKG